MIIYGARVSYRGTDSLDITRKGRHPQGIVLAPSDALLWPAIAERKRNHGEVSLETWMRYFDAYSLEMRASYRQHRATWEQILETGGVLSPLDGCRILVLTCYCTNPLRCHRTPAGMFLAAASRGRAEYRGECEPAPTGPPAHVRINRGRRGCTHH